MAKIYKYERQDNIMVKQLLLFMVTIFMVTGVFAYGGGSYGVLVFNTEQDFNGDRFVMNSFDFEGKAKNIVIDCENGLLSYENNKKRSEKIFCSEFQNLKISEEVDYIDVYTNKDQIIVRSNEYGYKVELKYNNEIIETMTNSYILLAQPKEEIETEFEEEYMFEENLTNPIIEVVIPKNNTQSELNLTIPELKVKKEWFDETYVIVYLFVIAVVIIGIYVFKK